MNTRCGQRSIPIHLRPLAWLRISRSLAVAAICLALFLLFHADSDDSRVGASPRKDSVPDRQSDLNTLLRALGSKDENASIAAMAAMRYQHQLLVERLMMIAEAPQKEVDVSPKGRAITLLALYGARDAAPFFAQNIEYFEPELIRDLDRLAGYPCAKALWTLRAESEIFTFLRKSRARKLSDEAIQLFACVLFSVHYREGGKLEAIAVVERAIERTPKDRQGDLIRVRDWLRNGDMWPGSPPRNSPAKKSP